MPDLISIIKARPVSLTLLLLTTSVSITAFRRRDLYHQWLLHPASILKRREYYRLLISGFVHNDMGHLLINGIMITFIGGEFETFLDKHSFHGGSVFLVIYLASHVFGASMATWSNRKNYDYSSAGASGSILGCMMGFMILAPDYVAFYLPVAGPVSNQYAALILIAGLIIYQWRSGNELLDNELHFYSAVGGIASTIAFYPHLL